MKNKQTKTSTWVFDENFSYSKSMANSKAFHWSISSSINLLLLKCEECMIHLQTCCHLRLPYTLKKTYVYTSPEYTKDHQSHQQIINSLKKWKFHKFMSWLAWSCVTKQGQMLRLNLESVDEKWVGLDLLDWYLRMKSDHKYHPPG